MNSSAVDRDDAFSGVADRAAVEEILRPIAAVRVSMGMNARFDIPSSCCAMALPNVACCPRSTGADDDAPFLFALPLLLLERGLEFLIRHAPESLRLAGITRQ